MEKRSTVLFFTNAELSQSAVNLATAAELARDTGYGVHFATFGALGKDVIPQGVTYHVVPGRAIKEIALSKGLEFMPRHPPGVQGALQAYDEAMVFVMAPHDDEAEYFAVFDHCVDLIKKLNPALVVSDPLFNAGVDAARFLHKRHVILSPGSFKDHCLHLQSNLQFAWKWPVVCSGFPTPLPLSYIPSNVYLLYQLIRRSYFNPRVVSLVKARAARGIPGNLPAKYNFIDPAVLYLVPSVRETEFPLAYIPPNLVGCGPLLPPFVPLALADPELARWLRTRPTVIVNMGSHLTYGAQQAGEVLAALEQFAARHPDKQVLWKYPHASLPNAGKGPARVRLLAWLPSTPVACLTASAAAGGAPALAYVHHGGANSFNEAVAAAVPQVVCPVWTDTYDFAARVEHMGVGVRGNAAHAPNVRAEELAAALDRVAGDSPEAMGFREQARALAKVVGGPETGRKIAVEQIRKFMAS
ncbi:uncharacterized protein PG998_004616 [Apiospora kogelbergensis]|uniref:uncharacterized protein n=1 Tax=Apiospora kogelbergensis TaxID=1337665 RepID=UPI00313068A3